MRDFFRGKFFLTLVFIAAFLAGFMLNMLLDGGVTPHRELIGIILTPINSFGAWIKNSTTDFFSSYSKYEAVLKENEQLKKHIIDLERKNNELNALKIEIDRLRQWTGVSETTPSLSYISADVVSISTDGFGTVFSVNKGTLDKIELNAVVISNIGLVGKVTEIGLNWAKITAITDPSVAVGAMIIRTGDIGMTEGTFDLRSKGLLKLSYLPENNTVNRGDSVYSSGLGGVYPQGLLIGTVAEIITEENGLTQYAIIEPAVDFSELRRVYITVRAWEGQ